MENEGLLYRYRKMLTKKNLDAVIIATPNSFHREQALGAAEAKVHVLVEKPMAITNKEAWDIVEGCKKAGVKLMVGCDRRFWLQNEYAKQLVEEGLIGKALMGSASLYEHWYLYQNHVAKTDFRLKAELAGAVAVSDKRRKRYGEEREGKEGSSRDNRVWEYR